MRSFGILFVALGVVSAGVAARAISDPDSPIGWERWGDDPWSAGLFLGAALIAIGVSLLVAARRVGPAAARRTTRVISSLVGGFVGFLLLAPVGITAMCTDAINGRSGCVDQDWSTITGLTFSGSPNPLPAVVLGAVVGAGIWFVAGRLRKTEAQPAGPVNQN